MNLTFAQLKTKLRTEMWPAGEARSLRTVHDSMFVAALMDLQTWVKCLQKNNISRWELCGTYWEDAKTVVQAPKGVIQAVYTIANEEWRDKVRYRPSNFHDINCWAKWLYDAVTPENENLPALPHGFRHAEASVDKGERARTGIWAIHNKRLYVAPWIESNEWLVVEWDGKKDDWSESDVFDTEYWNSAVQEAIKDYVRAKHESSFGDPALGRYFEDEYGKKLQTLIHVCREETMEQEDKTPCNNARPVRAEELEDDEVPEETTEYTVCAIGDLTDGEALTDNLDQIEAIDPGRLILGGDLGYGHSYETVFGGRLEEDFGKTDDQSTNKVFAIPGNHDIDDDADLSDFYLNFAGNKNNLRYYDFVYGPMHFFMLSTDSREEDGGYVDATTSTQNSVMGKWLQAKLALSTAKYKIVVGHHAPYTSDENNTPGNRWMRWPFKDWGADMYIDFHGHNAEHVQVSDFNYFTNGLGGHSKRDFGADTSGTILKQYNSDYAFYKLVGNCDALTVSFIDRNGTEVYSFEYTN